MNRRNGTKFIFGNPDPEKVIVSMIEHQGFLYVATKKGVYRIEDEKMIRLEFVDKGPLKVKRIEEQDHEQA